MNASRTGIARAARRLAPALLLLLLASGCAQVRAFQRERLTDPIMSFDAVAKDAARRTKAVG